MTNLRTRIATRCFFCPHKATYRAEIRRSCATSNGREYFRETVGVCGLHSNDADEPLTAEVSDG